MIGDIVRQISKCQEMKVVKRLTNLAYVIRGMLRNPSEIIEQIEVAAVTCEWYEDGKLKRKDFEDSKLELIST